MNIEKENELDTLGARLKRYEMLWNEKAFDKSMPLYVRLDGRHFSKLTSKMGYPYSDLVKFQDKTNSKYSAFFYSLMRLVAGDLLIEFRPDIVEVHSDEISLGWKEFKNIPFNGRFFKILSNIPSYAAVSLYKRACMFKTERPKLDSDYLEDVERVLANTPSFDCRMFQVPDVAELINCFIWRQNDCIRGTINQYAQRYFSPKELQNKSVVDRCEMLKNSGHKEYIESEDFVRKVHGSWFVKKTIELPMPEEYKKFNPEKTTVTRNIVVELDVPQLGKIPFADRERLLFGESSADSAD